MSKTLSTAVAGGLMSAATVMGIGVAPDEAQAVIRQSQQVVPFSISVEDLNPDAMTCCPFEPHDFLFDAFDTRQGALQEATFEFTSDLDTASGDVETLSADLNFGGNFLVSKSALGPFDYATDLIGRAGFTVADFIGPQLPMRLGITVDFPDLRAPDMLQWTGEATLTYTYDAVPLPPAILLLGGGLLALGAVTARQRARRER